MNVPCCRNPLASSDILGRAAVISVLVTLGGCVSSAQYLADQCAARGIAAGSPEMQQCVAEQESQLEQTRALGRRAGGGGPNR